MMLPDGTPKDDVKVPEGQIGNDIEAAFEVTVTIIAAMGMSSNCDRARPLEIPSD
jgi:translation initiation factor 5A